MVPQSALAPSVDDVGDALDVLLTQESDVAEDTVVVVLATPTRMYTVAPAVTLKTDLAYAPPPPPEPPLLAETPAPPPPIHSAVI